jgi:hypothetical protein
MENAVHHDLPRLDLIEDGVRESPDERSTHGRIDKLEGPQMALNRREARVDGGKKVGRSNGRLPVVPEVSLVEIKLGLERETEPLHLRRRSLARTCAQDFAADGFLAWARRRRASSLRWAWVTGTASGVSTRLSQISSRSRSRSATLRDWISFRTILMAAFSASRSATTNRPSARITITLSGRGERRRAPVRSSVMFGAK